jgi:hypothetical protein
VLMFQAALNHRGIILVDLATQCGYCDPHIP